MRCHAQGATGGWVIQVLYPSGFLWVSSPYLILPRVVLCSLGSLSQCSHSKGSGLDLFPKISLYPIYQEEIHPKWKCLYLSLKTQCTRTQQRSLTQLKLSIACHVDRPPWIATVDWGSVLGGGQQNWIYDILFMHCPLMNTSVQFNCSVMSNFCNLMDCNTPGFLVHHQLPELTQTHVHRVRDAIQPSHPLSSPLPSSFNLSQHQIFSNESVLHIR